MALQELEVPLNAGKRGTLRVRVQLRLPASAAHARLALQLQLPGCAGELLPLPFLRYRRVKIQGRGRVGDRSTVPLLLKL